jgi:hypothetical protein
MPEDKIIWAGGMVLRVVLRSSIVGFCIAFYVSKQWYMSLLWILGAIATMDLFAWVVGKQKPYD